MTDNGTSSRPSTSGDAEAGGDADAPRPPWLRRVALRVRDAASGSWMITLLLLADLVTVLGAGAIWLSLGGDATLVGVSAAALLAFAAAMLPLIGRLGPDGQAPLWPPFVLVVIPLAVLAVGLPAWATSVFRESRPVNVTNRVDLTPGAPLKDGDKVTVSVPNEGARSRLVITFEATPYDPAAPMCVPGTELAVTYKAGAGKDQVVTAAHDAEFAFALGQGATDVELAALLHAEQGCEVALSVVSASLDD